MQFSSRKFADVVVAAPVGRIDHAAAGQLEQALAPLIKASPDANGGLILDFSGVDYISSVGLRVLMIAAKQMRGRGAPIAVAALQPVVSRDFRDQPLRQRPRGFPVGPRRDREALAGGARRFDAAS